jgi:hypothetical protein
MKCPHLQGFKCPKKTFDLSNLENKINFAMKCCDPFTQGSQEKGTRSYTAAKTTKLNTI